MPPVLHPRIDLSLLKLTVLLQGSMTCRFCRCVGGMLHCDPRLLARTLGGEPGLAGESGRTGEATGMEMCDRPKPWA